MTIAEGLTSNTYDSPELAEEGVNSAENVPGVADGLESGTSNQQVVVPRVRTRPTPEHVESAQHHFILREPRFSD